MYVQKGKKEGFPFGESDSMSSDLIKLKDPELCPLVHYISFWQNHGPKNVLHLNSLIPSTVTYYLFKPGSNKSQKAYFIDGIISAPPVLLKPRCTQSLLSNIVKKKKLKRTIQMEVKQVENYTEKNSLYMGGCNSANFSTNSTWITEERAPALCFNLDKYA